MICKFIRTFEFHSRKTRVESSPKRKEGSMEKKGSRSAITSKEAVWSFATTTTDNHHRLNKEHYPARPSESTLSQTMSQKQVSKKIVNNRTKNICQRIKRIGCRKIQKERRDSFPRKSTSAPSKQSRNKPVNPIPSATQRQEQICIRRKIPTAIMRI